jgi:hypothetical protein
VDSGEPFTKAEAKRLAMRLLAAVSFRFDGATAIAVVVRTAWRIRRAP